VRVLDRNVGGGQDPKSQDRLRHNGKRRMPDVIPGGNGGSIKREEDWVLGGPGTGGSVWGERGPGSSEGEVGGGRIRYKTQEGKGKILKLRYS